MRYFMLLLCTLCFALPAQAERKHVFGDLTVHYSAFNSSFLQPEIAAANGLVRSKQQGVVNIAVFKAKQASAARVTGTVKNLLSQLTTLEFKQIKEGEAIYYIAQFPFDQQEMLKFTLSVQVGSEPAQSFSFDQEFFPDL